MIGIDTNILVYAFDDSDPKKRSVCKRILEGILDGREKGAVTMQILAEFARAITQKVPHPLSRKEAADIVGGILYDANWQVFSYEGDHIVKALASAQPFWYALIAQTLLANHVTTIITENVKDFSGSGLKAKCPF